MKKNESASKSINFDELSGRNRNASTGTNIRSLDCQTGGEVAIRNLDCQGGGIHALDIQNLDCQERRPVNV